MEVLWRCYEGVKTELRRCYGGVTEEVLRSYGGVSQIITNIRANRTGVDCSVDSGSLVGGEAYLVILGIYWYIVEDDWLISVTCQKNMIHFIFIGKLK